jgi:hypothetical protein
MHCLAEDVFVFMSSLRHLRQPGSILSDYIYRAQGFCCNLSFSLLPSFLDLGRPGLLHLQNGLYQMMMMMMMILEKKVLLVVVLEGWDRHDSLSWFSSLLVS